MTYWESDRIMAREMPSDLAFSQTYSSARMVVHHAHELQVRQIPVLFKLLEFSRPFVHAIEIRELVVIPTEELIRDRLQSHFRRERNRRAGISGMPDRRRNPT